MLNATSITFHSGDRVILDHITLSLKRETLALVGPNGAGKTTLLRILAGELMPHSGTVSGQSKIGYVPQQLFFAGSIDAFVQRELGFPVAQYELDGALRKVQAASLSLDQPIHTLSGGEKTKLLLASTFLTSPPEVLLLDEPTNNLDLQGLQWLESFLVTFDGPVVISSHDERFLENTAHRVVELQSGTLTWYGGGYSFYKEEKAQQTAGVTLQYEKNIAERKRLETLVAQKKEQARQVIAGAKNAPRDNDKFAKTFFTERAATSMDRTAKAVESRLMHLQEIEKHQNARSYPFTFTGETPRGKTLLRLEKITHSFDKREVLHSVSLEVQGQERVWLNAPNGSGKSLLLKIATKQITPNEGAVIPGENVQIGYFSQELLAEKLETIALHELLKLDVTPTQAHKYAIFFHLKPEDLAKPQTELSRGQRTKVECMKLLSKETQLLILDEPTNHVEIETRQHIEEALQGYKGAILFTSHDRAFVEAMKVEREVKLG